MSSNVNPMQLIGMMRRSGNPQEFVMNMVQEQMGNNPMFANILQLAKANKTQDIENIARNLMKERGLDFDTEFNSFRQMFGL